MVRWYVGREYLFIEYEWGLGGLFVDGLFGLLDIFYGKFIFFEMLKMVLIFLE